MRQDNLSRFSRDIDKADIDRANIGRADIDRALKEKKEREVHLDAIRGCLFGGAAGDALGYPVDFLDEESIFRRYGAKGITAYDKDPSTGKALISDDTQMTLFTADGLLIGETRGAMRGIRGMPRGYVTLTYLDWLKTQESSMKEANRFKRPSKDGGYSWLLDVPELYSRRAPGNTCLSALREESRGETFDDYVEAKRNGSKGCGGIMRVAPLALDPPGFVSDIPEVETPYYYLKPLVMEGAQLAAITHGHSLGYMPAAVLVHIITRIVFPPEGREMTLKEIILEARDAAEEFFAGDPHLPELLAVIENAMERSENGRDDLENIHQLGEGWVAEETLGISLYCALRHQDDFSAGIIAAVNHRGDSDSTGAVTGNILGALLGYEKIDDKWKKDLELSDVILEMADDLCHGCLMSEYSRYRDPEWEEKYMHMHRLGRNAAGGADVAGGKGTIIRLVQGDITKVSDVEAIVNAANKSLLGGGGVDSAIHRAAGRELLEECRKLHGCDTGNAKLTGAYKLPCKYVIHTVGPVWNGGRRREAELLAGCYRNSLQVAVDHQIRSVAFPSISTGVYRYPVDQAAELAVRTVFEFLDNHPGELDLVEWVLFDRRTYDAYENALTQLQAERIVNSPMLDQINRMLRDGLI